jgi:hypothetical protein
MSTYLQPRASAAFLITELDRYLSRRAVTIAAGNKLIVGAVLGKLTATGHYAPYSPGADDGSERASAILIYAVDATAGDMAAQVIAANANVNAHELEWGAANSEEIAAGVADLAEVGVKVIA